MIIEGHKVEVINNLTLYASKLPFTFIIILVIAIVLDYITGLLRALYERKGNSKTHYTGIIKKIGIIIGVLIGTISDLLLSDNNPIITTMLIIIFVGGECLSIIENLGVMGVSIPPWLKDRLTQVIETVNEEEINEVKNKESVNERNIKGETNENIEIFIEDEKSK